MSRLDDIGTADGWRCWLCDEAVDPNKSVNDDRGPSIDSMSSKGKAKGKAKTKAKPQKGKSSKRRWDGGDEEF